MKNTFYVLRESEPLNIVLRYRMFSPSTPYSGTGVETAENATRFASVADAIRAQSEYAVRSGMSVVRELDIIRVTETTTEPSTTTREVPLGSKEQTGVAIKGGREYWTGARTYGTGKYSLAISEAKVFLNIACALRVLQDAVKDNAMFPITNPSLVGVAVEFVPGAVSYDEVVLG